MMFVALIAASVLISLVVNGIYIAMRDKMILGWLWQWSELNLPEYLKKPVSHCIYCMASVWNGGIGLICAAFGLWPIWWVPFIALSGIYLNGLFNALLYASESD